MTLEAAVAAFESVALARNGDRCRIGGVTGAATWRTSEGVNTEHVYKNTIYITCNTIIYIYIYII